MRACMHLYTHTNTHRWWATVSTKASMTCTCDLNGIPSCQRRRLAAASILWLVISLQSRYTYTDRQTDKQTDRQTHTHTHTHMYREHRMACGITSKQVMCVCLCVCVCVCVCFHTNTYARAHTHTSGAQSLRVRAREHAGEPAAKHSAPRVPCHSIYCPPPRPFVAFHCYRRRHGTGWRRCVCVYVCVRVCARACLRACVVICRAHKQRTCWSTRVALMAEVWGVSRMRGRRL